MFQRVKRASYDAPAPGFKAGHRAPGWKDPHRPAGPQEQRLRNAAGPGASEAPRPRSDANPRQLGCEDDAPHDPGPFADRPAPLPSHHPLPRARRRPVAQPRRARQPAVATAAAHRLQPSTASPGSVAGAPPVAGGPTDGRSLWAEAKRLSLVEA